MFSDTPILVIDPNKILLIKDLSSSYGLRGASHLPDFLPWAVENFEIYFLTNLHYDKFKSGPLIPALINIIARDGLVDEITIRNIKCLPVKGSKLVSFRDYFDERENFYWVDTEFTVPIIQWAVLNNLESQLLVRNCEEKPMDLYHLKLELIEKGATGYEKS